jgi:hypothetical protein
MKLIKKIKIYLKLLNLGRQEDIFSKHFKKANESIQKASKIVRHPDFSDDSVINEETKKTIIEIADKSNELQRLIDYLNGSKPKGLLDAMLKTARIAEWEKTHTGVKGKIKW